jgi:FG-GAP repeat
MWLYGPADRQRQPAVDPEQSGIVGLAEPGDLFGFALAAGDFNGDGAADLAVGVYGEDDFAGAVNVLYGRPTD